MAHNVLDFKSGQVTAHYASHGRDNGPNARAIKFKGFQTNLDMVPLGPLKTYGDRADMTKWTDFNKIYITYFQLIAYRRGRPLVPRVLRSERRLKSSALLTGKEQARNWFKLSRSARQVAVGGVDFHQIERRLTHHRPPMN
jgi:hypothetical protein